jgi:hypothetical protein
LFGAAGLLYAPTLSHPPIWDDHAFLFGLPFLRKCSNLGRVVSLEGFRGVLLVRGSARPVWLATVLADTCLGDGRIEVYRATSVLWHALGAVLLAFLTWRLSRDDKAALAAGAFFAVHPLHVEPVSIITYRSDLLCLAFMLGCVFLHHESRRRAGWAAGVLFALSMAAAALAMLSKEPAVVLPLLLPLTDIMFPTGPSTPRRRRALWLGAGACLALVGCYLVFRAPRSGYVMGGFSDVFSGLRKKTVLPFSVAIQEAGFKVPETPLEPVWGKVYVDPGARARTMSRIFGSYLRRLVWPWPLQGDYAPEVVSSWLHPGVLGAWTLWALLLGAGWKMRREIPLAAYGVFWTAVTLLPVSGAIALYNLEADRYLYIPSAGACMAAGALFSRMRREPRRQRAATALAAAIICAGALLVTRRVKDFRTEEAFYRATLAVDPNVPRAHLGLAQICADQGREDCAVQECRETLRLEPDYRKAQIMCAGMSR